MKYKLSTFNFQLSTLLLVVVFFASPLKAQVKIGDLVNPQSYSIVEIDTTTYKGGLRMPQLTTFQRDSIGDILKQAINQVAGKGLVIFNTDTKCLEFWNGSAWISLCSDILAQSAIPKLTITGPVSVYKGSTGLANYSVESEPGVTYQWTISGTGMEITGGQGSGSISVEAPATPGGDSDYTVTVTSSDGLAGTLNVHVLNCGAYVADGVWKEFMCWNLGADYSADPFNPSANLNGDYYQWGYKTPVATRDAVTGTWNSNPYSTYYGDGSLASWPNYIFDYNSFSSNVTVKSLSDPCPDGYRVPSFDEWKYVMINTASNPKTNKPADTWTAGDVNWSGSMFGDSLFLPAAGYRIYISGTLNGRGLYGSYWTNSSIDVPVDPIDDLDIGTAYFDINSSSMDFSTTFGYTVAGSEGTSVRCIAQ